MILMKKSQAQTDIISGKNFETTINIRIFWSTFISPLHETARTMYVQIFLSEIYAFRLSYI